jgi:hypothetical protein
MIYPMIGSARFAASAKPISPRSKKNKIITKPKQNMRSPV